MSRLKRLGICLKALELCLQLTGTHTVNSCHRLWAHKRWPASALVAPAGNGAREDQEAKPKRRGTAYNKIYPLRSLRCRGSSRARVCAAKIADGAQAGRLLLRAAASRSDHIDGA
ncbi:hypothetical protein Turpa_3305 [Turneriella parva DSM 21527]|jgi:hypothetical protein|uniref:Uncharacterized protein n=1 Tax=Turneriella parva (strain ATCC BAA-1111 / DSM 21527 / NCTC 11395 / H) TaxID=869212 RepID=I4B9I6_TURPD|nr:hypothetical protein Turpa_3305 [Turneriella parva DSM 21527]